MPVPAPGAERHLNGSKGVTTMKKRIVALILALVLLVPCALASAEVYYRLKDRAKLRQLPNYSCVVLDSYRADWALTINNVVDKNWASITFTNGKVGYIERSHLVRCSSSSAWIKKNETKLRHGPDYSFATLAVLSKGDKVTVITKGNNYSYVKTSQGYGYVPTSILSKKKVQPDPGPKPGPAGYDAWVTSKGGTVGLRSAPSTSKNVVIADIAYGTPIHVEEYGSSFCYVTVNGMEGYMRTKYISKVQPAPLPTAKPTPAPFVPYTTTATQDSKGNTPRLYQGEGLGWSSVKLEVGDVVEVIARGKDPYWVKVTVGGSKGYMPLKFLN